MRRLIRSIASMLFVLSTAWTVPAGAVEQILDATGGPGPSSGLDRPYALATDAAGNVYVAGSNSDNVFEVTPEGVITELIDATGAGLGQALQTPEAVAADAAGNVYVAGRESDNAFRIAVDGTITRLISATGDGAGNPLDAPSAIAVDSAGNVFVAGGVSDNVFRIDPSGAIAIVIDSAGAGFGRPLDGPSALAIDGDDNVYVAGAFSDNVLKRSPAGVITEILHSGGDGDGHFFGDAIGLGTGPDGSVYAAGGNLFRVAPDGEVFFLNAIAGPLAVGGDSRIYVAVPSSGVASYNPSGANAGPVINTAGDGQGNPLSGARGVAVDASGNVFVSGVSSDNVFVVPAPAPDGDDDFDFVANAADNCLRFDNGPNDQSNQIDSDQDGIGNACDGDLNQDGYVSGFDFDIIVQYFGSASAPPSMDFTGDGLFTGTDFNRFVVMFSRPVGPSGLACADPTIKVDEGDAPCRP